MVSAMSSDISHVILSVLGTYDECGKEINGGKCVEFAQKVCDECEDAYELSWKTMVPWLRYNSPAGTVFTGHEWVCVNGRHFDAETPYGVAKFYKLPFIQRHIELSSYDSAVEILRKTHQQKNY